MTRPPSQTERTRLPVWRAGFAGGLVGMLCCVGPTVLALIGVVSASTAYVWATDLYGGYAWWFRLAGVVVLVGTIWLVLRRRNMCTAAGVRRVWRRLLALVAIAVGTYLTLYALTTWLGTLA